jgi:hypothetical protein
MIPSPKEASHLLDQKMIFVLKPIMNILLLNDVVV